MPVPPSSAEILNRLSDLHPKAIDLSLDRIERLLATLGRPQDRLPTVVHVAGTNGKGSVVAFLRAMLEAAGLRVHVYTSPHLVRFTERIVLASREIGEAALVALLQDCERRNAGAPITIFEIITAAAFLGFARERADVTLLETGLGGRLDATNVVARPALTAITPVSLDHQGFLGETLGAIAYEKAGILKRGVGCVVAAQEPAAAATIRARAAAVGTSLFEEGRDWRVDVAGNGLRYEDERTALTLPRPALAGVHQVHNAGAAIACALCLAGSIPGVSAEAIGQGLRGVRWPARLQCLSGGRLASLLPASWELWLDGGHNPGAAAVLAQHLAGWRDRPLFLVIGMLRSKDAAAFLRPLAPHARRLLAVPVPEEPASLRAEEVAEIAKAAGIAAEAEGGAVAALQRLAAAAEGPARVLICGSLYLAGHVLAEDATPM